jgi:hypothetical protein
MQFNSDVTKAYTPVLDDVAVYYNMNSAPASPTSLTQLKNDASTTISNQGYTNETNVKLRASATDADTTEVLTLFFELVESSGSFNSPATPTTGSSCASGTSYTDCTNKIWYVTSDSGDYSSTPYTGTTNVTGLSNGTGYKWQVKACDDNSACSDWVVFNATTPNFTIDTSAPSGPTNVTSSDHTTSTWSNDNTITMNWTAATDSGSGLAGYSYVFDTTSDTIPDTTQDIGTVTTVDSTTLSDGNNHYFHIRAVDNLGNWGETVHAGPYFIDKTAPSIPGLPSTTTPTTDTTPTWNWTASTDSGSGLHTTTPYSVQWCQDQNFTGCDANISTSNTNSFTHSVALADGTWYFRVKAKDAVNNESNYSSNGSALIDTTPPTGPTNVTSSDHTTSTWSNDNTITMNWTAATDSGSGLAGYSYVFDTTSDTIPDTTQDIGTVTTVDSTTLSDGNNHYFHIRAVDNLGNWGETVHAGPYFIDKTAPSIPGLPSTTTPTTDTTPTWNWTASTDSGSGLHTTTPYSVQWCQDQNFTGCDANISTSNTNSFTHSVALADGTWYFRVKAKDALNQESDYSDSGTVLIDSTAPTIIQISSITADSTSQLTIRAEDSDDVSGYFFQETSGNPGASSSTEYQSSRIFIDRGLSANTQYTYRVKVKDSLDNESSYSSALSKYTLAPTPTNLSVNLGISSATLTVSSLNNDTADSSGYYFYRQGGTPNSGWIQTNTWLDTNISCNNQYTWFVKYRNGDGIETDTISITQSAANCGAVIIPPQPTPLPTPLPETTDKNQLIQNLQQQITELIKQINQLKTQLQQLLQEQGPEIPIPQDFRFKTPLYYGQTSQEVRYLQVFLKSQGADIYPEGLVTGYFGPLTKQAVTKFQLKYNLIDSENHIAAGYVGPRTRERMNQLLKQ